MPKIVDREQKKREIVSKALDVFSQSGFQEANLGQIASRCGCSRTSLYNYFKNKEEIYYFALDSVLSKIEADSKLIMASNYLSIDDKIKGVTKAVLQDIAQNYKSTGLMVDFWFQIKNGNLKVKEKVQDYNTSLQDIFKSLLDEGKHEGFFKPIDSSAISLTLLSLIQSFIVSSVLTEMNFVDAGMSSVTLFLNSLRK
ncbi:MAG: TetR/AcrR family transcriptional regulator [Spirochaetaceae bacterium]|nr:TetR/AcrR family transcriptional regulator [Spirochaetaceae bacterium]